MYGFMDSWEVHQYGIDFVWINWWHLVGYISYSILLRIFTGSSMIMNACENNFDCLFGLELMVMFVGVV